MSKKTRKNILLAEKEETAWKTMQGLAILAATLSYAVFCLKFKINYEIWPVWMKLYRLRIIGFLLFVLLYVIFSAPIMIAFNSDPRPLSGPR